jgi:signal transduction histidine kinase
LRALITSEGRTTQDLQDSADARHLLSLAAAGRYLRRNRNQAFFPHGPSDILGRQLWFARVAESAGEQSGRRRMTDNVDDDLTCLPREDLVARARALQTVLRVASAVTTARGVEDLSRRFAEAVAAYTRFPSVVVLRFSPTREVFDLVAQHGFDESKFPADVRALPAKGSLTGLAAERREILTTDDIASDDRLDAETRQRLSANDYTSGACVPLIHAEQVLGSFNLIYPRGTALGADEYGLLGALGTSLAVAMAQQIAFEKERQLEEQAGRAQKLDSLGVLAGGIAHDFNNLLAGIVGNVDLARAEAQEAGHANLVDLLDGALAAAARAAALAKQLLTFARGGAPARKIVDDLGATICDVAAFAARGTSVRCELEIAEPLGVVEVDVGQIGQVIQNLVLNACQASARGATVRVRARREHGDGDARIVIEVIDTGSGIAPEHRPRLFEPFFTVRPGGTGLGLAVSHSIVQRHGGRLYAHSELGRGSTFTVELPASDRPLTPESSTVTHEVRFVGRALVMDDEDAVRRVAAALLTRLGFEVESVAHGAAALDLAAQRSAEGRPFRVALLDLTIVGGLGAADIKEQLRHASPGIRLFLTTGYEHEGAGEEWDGQLPKPYTLRTMIAALETALGSGAGRLSP